MYNCRLSLVVKCYHFLYWYKHPTWNFSLDIAILGWLLEMFGFVCCFCLLELQNGKSTKLKSDSDFNFADFPWLFWIFPQNIPGIFCGNIQNNDLSTITKLNKLLSFHYTLLLVFFIMPFSRVKSFCALGLRKGCPKRQWGRGSFWLVIAVLTHHKLHFISIAPEGRLSWLSQGDIFSFILGGFSQLIEKCDPSDVVVTDCRISLSSYGKTSYLSQLELANVCCDKSGITKRAVSLSKKMPTLEVQFLVNHSVNFFEKKLLVM